MSEHTPSTDLDDLQFEFVREELQKIVRKYCNADHHLETLFVGVMRYADVLETHGTINGSSLPRSELERIAFEAFEAELMPQHPISPVSKEDESFAEELAIVRDSSLQDLVTEIRVITKDLDEFRPADPSEMDLDVFLFWLRLLALRATCLQGVGSYKAAILDCTSGLSAIDQCRVLKSMTHATKMILSAVLAFSKLKMGDNNKAPFVDAIESCDKLLAAEHSTAVIDLANATRASLTSERDDVESTLRLPLGLDRITRLYGHSPACMHTFSVLVRDLSLSHQYHQVASACERWVMSALLHQDLQLVGLSEKFAQAPGFPIAAILDGANNPYVTFADPSNIVKSTNRKVLHHYLVALLMQDRREEAGFLLKHAAGTFLHVESYWLVLRALEYRTEGNRLFESAHMHLASEKYKMGLKILTDPISLFLISRILKDDARLLLAATLRFKIGMCRWKQLSDDTLRIFDECLTDVPDYMEALEASASWKRRLMDLSGTGAEVYTHCLQAKAFYEKFIGKYKEGKASTYPNVCGITFPNRVTKAKYRKIKKELASLEESKQHCCDAADRPPPTTPPNSVGHNTCPEFDLATADAIHFFGMDAATGTKEGVRKWLKKNHPDKVPAKDRKRAHELLAQANDNRTNLAIKYFELREAFRMLHISADIMSMSAIDEEVRKISPGRDIRKEVVMVKTHVARMILNIPTSFVVDSRSDLRYLCRVRNTREKEQAYSYLEPLMTRP